MKSKNKLWIRCRAFANLLPSWANAVAWSPRWYRRAAWAGGGLLAIWVLAYAIVPYVAKSQIEKIATEKFGRRVTVGSVSFKPWSLELTINNFAIAKANASGEGPPTNTPQLSIKRIYIDAALQSLLRLGPVADAIVVDQPIFSLTHLGEGRYDIDDVLRRFQPASDDSAGEPTRFALYNLTLTGGQLDFNDQSVHKVQALRDFKLSVPFLSNLPSKREIKTEPRLAFKLNGSSFDTAAIGTPFAQTRKTDASIALRDLDLSPYLAYWPASLPYQLQAAVLNADVKIAFEQTPATVMRISGTATADKVRLTSDAGRPSALTPGTRLAKRARPALSGELLSFDRLRVTMDDIRPFEQTVKLSAVELTAPSLFITRDRAGRLNLLPPTALVGRQDAIKNVANSASIESAAGIKKSTPSLAAPPASKASSTVVPEPVVKAGSSPSWRIQVARVAVRDGTVNWLDDALPSPAQVKLAGLILDASAIALPFTTDAPIHFKGAFGLGNPAQTGGAVGLEAKAPPKTTAGAALAKRDQGISKTEAASQPASSALISFKGSSTDQAAQVDATIAAWPLKLGANYVGQFLLPALSGQLDAQLSVKWQAAQGDKAPVIKLTAPQIAFNDLLLAQGKTALASVKRIDLSQVDIDVTGQSFRAAKILLTQPKAQVERDAEKRWMYEHWLVGPDASAVATSVKPPSLPLEAVKAQKPSWAVAVTDMQVDGGSVSFSDKAGAKPVAFEVTAFKAQLGGLVLNDKAAAKSEKAATGTPSMSLAASARLATDDFEPGKLDFNGSLGLAPLQAQGRLTVDRLPVQAFEPYFSDTLNIELLRADASFKGRVAYRQDPTGPQAQVSGDVALEEFRANTLAPSEDLLAWKVLSLRGLNVALDPAKATRVDVKETVLTDFFARVIVMPDGRINLQDLLRPAGSAAATSAATTAVDASKAVANTSISALPTGQKEPPSSSKAQSTVTVAAAPAPTAAPATTGPAPVINIGPMSLVNGKVLFSDRFVKPNYSADLSELTGKLSAFSSESSEAPGSALAAPHMADFELRGKAENTASLEILGQLNPLAKPLALDIKGKVRDLELPPLSPYAVKYSGYGITRGKLDVDVAYRVLPDGRLTATNKVVLNQLSFGDKVEGSTASLPVKLAVALLADRHGVIDLDLPISGSLNDPQFSLGPVIVKAIVNVIVKSITAPFSLLANAFGGGGGELSVVSFPPGSALLAPDARAGLDKLAKALADRPALRLTVVGTGSLDGEREGFKRARLDELLLAEKRRQTVKAGGTSAVELSISPAQYPALLKEVYQSSDIPKPRNLIGLVKNQPVDDMEKLLLAAITVSEDGIRELAVRRGVAVKDYLATHGLPPDRLFLGAAKTVVPEAKWTPRAELNLATP